MPRDGSGTYSLPAGSAAVSGATISSSKYNGVLNDMEQDANDARPVSAGGTGAASASAARTNLGVNRDNLGIPRTVLSKSSAYTIVDADRSKLIVCTAALTLTFPASTTVGDGWYIEVKAVGGTLTLTPDGSETIDGTAGNTVLQQGQAATVFCDGSNLFTIKTPTTGPIAETVISSATSNVDFDLDTSVYRTFRVEVMGVLPTVAANLLLRTSADGGSTIDSGVSDYSYTNSGILGGSAVNQDDTANSSVRLTTTVGTTDVRALCGGFRIYAAGDATARTTVLGSFHCRNESSDLATVVTSGRRLTASAHDFIRLSFSGTTIASGTFTLYGEV